MAGRPDVVVPILRAGVLAHQFVGSVAFANVEAVFERCFYLRSSDDFVCIGGRDIGNGPLTLVGEIPALPTLRFLAGQIALIRGGCITIGNSFRFTLDQSEPWWPFGWPVCPPHDRLIGICDALASLAAVAAPQEGLARCVIDGGEACGSTRPLARIARHRIALFERGMSGILDGRSVSAPVFREAVQGLIGLGPGLTPSGDDFLVGSLSALDALGEREAHTVLARAIVDAPPELTTPLSACFLRSAAAGHVGENLHQAVSLLLAGDVDAAIARGGEIGHSSGWDMMAGALTTLRIVAAVAQDSPAAHAFARS